MLPDAAKPALNEAVVIAVGKGMPTEVRAAAPLLLQLSSRLYVVAQRLPLRLGLLIDHNMIVIPVQEYPQYFARLSLRFLRVTCYGQPLTMG